MFAQFFVEHPRFALVVSLVISLVGLFSLLSLPVAQYPEIVPPEVKVEATYPGASAQILADTVASTLEDEINGVDDMLYMSSKSDDTGHYELTVTFAVGTDRNMAQVNVQNRIQQVESKLPDEVVREGITVSSTSSSILGIVTFYSPNGTISYEDIGNYVYTYVKSPLKRINGIGTADVLGPEYSMRVWMDSDRLTAMGISPAEVAAAITGQNIQAAIGSVGGSPSDDNVKLSFSLQARGRLNTPEEFENIVVRTDAQGGLVRLRDIGRVELNADLSNIRGWYNGETRCVPVQLAQTPGTNAIEAMKAVRAELKRLERYFPEGLEYTVQLDTTKFVTASIREVVTTLVVTFILVILVCYIFLQDWRATLVPLLAVPVSLLGAFIVVASLGYTLNLMTLFALVLVTGTVVDNAIVVVERVIFLMQEEGLDRKAATLKAMKQVGGAMTAATLVLLAIFVPVALVPGMTGLIYRQFAVTISASVLFSLLVAFTLSPAVCALIIKVPEIPRHGPLAWFNRGLNRTRQGYVHTASLLARRMGLTLLILLLVCAGAAWLGGELPGAFIPNEDQGYIFMDVRMPEGATLTRSEDLAQKMARDIMEIPGVESIVSICGYSMIGGRSENSTFCPIMLKDWDERKAPEQQLDAVLNRLREYTAGIPDASIDVFPPPAIIGLGNTGGQDFRLQAMTDNDPRKLQTVLNKILPQFVRSSEIQSAFSTYTADTPHLFLDVNREKALLMGVPVENIYSTLQIYFGKIYVNDINIGNQIKQVQICADNRFRADTQDLRKLYVKSNSGKMVSLNGLVTVSPLLAPRTVPRYNLFPSADVTAQGAAGISSGQVMEKMEQIANAALPAGYAYEWSSLSFQEKKTGNQIVFLLAAAVLFGYLFLVAQYESWMVPMPVIFSLSVAALGSLIGLAVRGLPLSIYAQLGLLIVVGISSKNAILIVEFAKEQREAGQGIVESAVVGARERFRAVLMTAFTCILGIFPMMLASSSAGAQSRIAVGTTVCVGMLIATVFGIILIPALYVLFQTLREKIKARIGSKEYSPSEETI